MKLYLHLLVLTLIIFLTSCKVGPNFSVPPSPEVSSYTSLRDKINLKNQHLELNKMVKTNWWGEFHSPALNQVMQLGIKNNYNLGAMQEALNRAHEVVNAAAGQLLPQVTLAASIGNQKYGAALFGPSNFTVPPFSYYTIGPSVNLVLDIFGGTRRLIEKQQALADYQNYLLQATVLSLTGNIATTAVNIANIKQQIITIKQILADDQKNLNLVETAFRLGSSTKTNVLSAKSQLNNDKTLLPPLYQQLNVASTQLNILVGIAPANWQAPSFDLNNFTLPKTLPIQLPSALLHNRPDILASESLLHAACANVGIATANLYPNITLSGTLLQEALSSNNLFNGSSNASSFAATITAPIFNGGSLRALRRAAMHTYNAAYENYQQVIIKAFVDVNNILHALQHDAEEISAQQQAVFTAQSSLKLARLSYAAGNIGILSVLDAERLYNQARLGYVRARAQQYQDTIRLYLALGGGLIGSHC